MADHWTRAVAHKINAPQPLTALPRQGTVTGTDPLEITLGKSDVRIPGVKKLAGLTWTPVAGQTIHVLRIGTDIIVLGPVE